MAKFDVYKFGNKSILLLDVQADILRDLETRIVIPLRIYSKVPGESQSRLKPVLNIQGQDYILLTSELATVLKKDLSNPICNIEGYHLEILTALDFLFQGF